MLRHELVEPAQRNVVDLPVVKAHLRVNHDGEDGLIQMYLDAATAALDGPTGILGLALGPQTWRAVFQPHEDIVLPLGPVMSQEAPVASEDEVSVTYVAGFPNGIPTPIRAAILLHVATLYQNREQSADGWTPTRAYEQLLAPWRRW